MIEEQILILGHRNPDLDSVAAALGYQQLKQHLEPDKNYRAALPGNLNRESTFVLGELNLAAPSIIRDIRTRASDLVAEPGTMKGTAPDTPLAAVAHILRSGETKTLAVVDAAGHLRGLFTLGDVARRFLSELWSAMDETGAGRNVQAILAEPVSSLMHSEPIISFDASDTIPDIRRVMAQSRYRNYPVTDEQNGYVGMISRYDLLRMERKKVVLVDHNEKSQAVEGIEEAEIIEIIDHHRLGDLQTANPILVRNEPVGATSTIIAEQFLAHQLELDKSFAGLLLAGILSDTMMFRSPTTTARDRRTAELLSQRSGLVAVEWGREIYRQASPVDYGDLGQLIKEDLKEYSFNQLQFAVAQIETAASEELIALGPEIFAAMEQVNQEKGYQCFLLMITDVVQGTTHLMIVGPKTHMVAGLFGETEERLFFLPGVMSRKKQIVPRIFQGLARQELLR